MIDGIPDFFDLFPASFCDSEAKQKSLHNLKIILRCLVNSTFD